MKAPRYVIEALFALVDYCNKHPDCEGCGLLDAAKKCAIDDFPLFDEDMEVENDPCKL